ncbi:Uncharacterised protein [Salmonella bongori]|nr:Uncharacterised protein [Salmonella bongori]
MYKNVFNYVLPPPKFAMRLIAYISITLYKQPEQERHMKNTESNVSSLPGLTSFEVNYSLLTNEV